jgi:hypothetical protein
MWETNSPNTRFHPDSSEIFTKVRKYSIKMGEEKMSISLTSRFMDYETTRYTFVLFVFAGFYLLVSAFHEITLHADGGILLFLIYGSNVPSREHQ